MWNVLAYISYLPHQKLVTAVTLISCSCVLVNVLNLLTFSVLSTCEDALGERWSRCFPRFFLAFLISVFGFGLSLYFATQGGRHAYELVTGSVKYITIFVILAFELLAIAWFYCAHKLGKDLHTMLRYSCCWCFGHFLLYFTYLLPVVPAGIAFFNAREYSFEAFSPPIHAWRWSEYVGAAVALVPLAPIILYFLFYVLASCCCSSGEQKGMKTAFATRLNPTVTTEKSLPPRYSNNAPGYLLLPQAPLAEPEYA
ncbi:unnamed protein product [Caenorhabditis auriculariae]|uniref:Uncharacterized protein n=1 Tax=Caenorhabditis auriculariae TaxID=2777116 RepID=A0A8S1HHY0_9PELO|nr:unnamed protein product [Caenorhabditis auriculariae]